MVGRLSIRSVRGFRFLLWPHGVLARPAAAAAERWRSPAAGTQPRFHHAAETGSDRRQRATPGPDDVSSCRRSEEQLHTPTDPGHSACSHTTSCQ